MPSPVISPTHGYVVPGKDEAGADNPTLRLFLECFVLFLNLFVIVVVIGGGSGGSSLGTLFGPFKITMNVNIDCNRVLSPGVIDQPSKTDAIKDSTTTVEVASPATSSVESKYAPSLAVVRDRVLAPLVVALLLTAMLRSSDSRALAIGECTCAIQIPTPSTLSPLP